MSDLFQPIAFEQLTEWVALELRDRDSVFGIPREHNFIPRISDRFRTTAFGHPLETPFGPAAGPHSQMAQNILVTWLCGSRYIELKTVQTIDELEVSKPCIDMEDEGYNVEWSQELKVYQSFDEYLRAWILIHALHKKFGYPGDAPGMVFNLSVGYNLEGIQKPNVQWFLEKMQDCSDYKEAYIDLVARHIPEVRDIEVPDQIADSITLSTMHGCPPDEIEKISEYLMKDMGLHTYVKCNPTLLGPDLVRTILNDDLKYGDVVVPDEAFGHDLKYDDAIPMLRRLQEVGRSAKLDFGVKLTNTLEVENFRPVFAENEKMMYLSGRPLHALTVNIAHKLSEEFDGQLPMSLSGGADCNNVAQLLGTGMQTVTVCSDLLKSGGYMRMLQYLENVHTAMDSAGAESIPDLICKAAGGTDVTACARENLRAYAEAVRMVPELKKGAMFTSRSKTSRTLNAFDCIQAPCTDECPVNQKVPHYMDAVRTGDLREALRLVREDNPVGGILGRVCDHLCENTCIRTHYEEPLAIRDIKRFILEHEEKPAMRAQADPVGVKVAVIGAGPGGMAAAVELGYAGFDVSIFEKHGYAGGMVGGAIPSYRLPQEVIDQDLAVLDKLGVHIHYNVAAGSDIHLSQLKKEGFEYIVIMVGAQLGKKLGLDGEECEGVMDALHFLRSVREERPVALGEKVGIIGAGDTAMDCARSAWRLGSGELSVIYRRSIDQMPADREEVHLLLEEGINVEEMAKPHRLHVEGGTLKGLVCTRMEFKGDRDASGRKIPHEIPDSEFEVPLDTMILAISQHAILDFFDEEQVKVNRWGYIEADPVSLETSVANVFAGGDVVNDGPSSIVKAAADGRRIADSISRRHDRGASREDLVPDVDIRALLKRRAERVPRVPLTITPAADRRNFSEPIQTYSEDQAKAEAARCLDCHAYCSLCVGVCPNLALMTYVCEPFEAKLPELIVRGESVKAMPGNVLHVGQAYQIAVLTDFCNECGDCVTFCPTAGEPYRDKPRLYLNREEFEAQPDNAYMVFQDTDTWSMDARWGGETHRIELNGYLEYESPHLRARIEPYEFVVEECYSTAADGTAISLEPCATMFVLLKSLMESMPYLPTKKEAVGIVSHPGYFE